MARVKLKNERLQRGLTTKQVAEQLGVSMQFVYLLETEKKDGTLKTWKKIQDIYNIPDNEMWSLMQGQ
ncbi:MAG: helix-turn-helix transcriptional regulator [Clostridia bacterium]|nr:helix-turn-helix transcriptional regulator [Clostridia bacterium]